MKTKKLSLHDFEAVGTAELLKIKGGRSRLGPTVKWEDAASEDDRSGGGNTDRCMDEVNNAMYYIGNSTYTWPDGHTEYTYSDRFLMEMGNEALAECMGYDVPGVDYYPQN